MNIRYFIISLLCLISIINGCMVLPTEPRLTENEKKYFIKLEKDCACKVTRDIDPRKPNERANLEEKGSYLIKLDSLESNVINKKDSLQKASKQIANELHDKILDMSFKYPYKKIVVSFNFNVTNNSSSNVIYEYNLEDLKAP